MPNWCYNSGEILTKTEDYAKQIKKSVDRGELMQFIDPMPDALNDTKSAGGTTITKTPLEETNAKLLQEKYGASNWYAWRNNNWGIKWDVESVNPAEIEQVPDTWSTDGPAYRVCVWFDSPWCPPEAAFQKLYDKPEVISVEFNYEEPGMCFRGTWKNGVDECEEWTEEDDG